MAFLLGAAVAVFLSATLIGERSRRPWRVWPKAAASTAFVLLAVAAGAADSTYGWWVLAALALGWIGDVALSVDRPPMFVVGLGAFLVSHVAYIVAFQVLGMRGIAALAGLGLLAVPAAAISRWLLPHVPMGLRVPVIAYIVVITAMAAAAVGAASEGAPWTVLTGALLFYLSDVFVARDRFVHPGFENRVIGLPMYYGAQVLLALSVGMT